MARELQILTWQQARADVLNTNPELATLIDQLSPDNSYQLIKASYLFGDLVIDNGVLQIPSTTGALSRYDDLSCDSEIKQQISYSIIPLILTLNAANEVFIDTGSRIIPLNLFYSGSLLGLFEIMDYNFNNMTRPKWSVSAGARSIFMLPKISESIGFKKLRMNFNIPPSLNLKKMENHWSVFSALASNENFEQPWRNEILIFTKKWLEPNFNDVNWVKFQQYLFGHAWHQAKFAIGKIELSLIWEEFINSIASRNLKPTPYIADQVKHLMAIASGRWPGFRPVDNSQQVAPTNALEKIFIDIYGLKSYLPTCMCAAVLNQGCTKPVYYSLNYPTLLEGSPLNRQGSTLMLDLRDIKLLIETYQNRAEHKTRNKSQFEFYHVEKDMYNEIQSSELIGDTDADFLSLQTKYPEREFCATSPFWRGCIKLAP